MATPEVIRKLLLNYFQNGPQEDLVVALEAMYTALSAAQRNDLNNQVKVFLLPKAQADVASAGNALSTIQTQVASAITMLESSISAVEAVVAEINSL